MILTLNFNGYLANLKLISKSLPLIGGESWNATFSFQTASELIVDPLTGNYIPSSPITVELKAKMYQIQRPSQSLYSDNQGANLRRTYFEGMLVQPLHYPVPYEKQTTGMNASINGIKGIFYPILEYEYYEAYMADIDSSLGQAISGFFEILNA